MFYYLTVSVGACDSRSLVRYELSARAAVTSEDSPAERSASGFPHLVAGKTHFLIGC